ncbi:DUF3138 family protein [Massilia sp. W12]|uniref:DUF3138 family protein n=1 Tax=Massilia sp. W12 TaxID=3126507 RepID=UPI0030CBFE81
MPKLKLSALIATLFAAHCGLAHAQSNAELKAELDALKAQVKRLEALLEKKQADDAAKAETVDVAEFNRIRIKTEAMEDAQEVMGFKGLKISGYIDPTYIHNRNAKTSSFVFLNNNSSVNGSEESFGYDNTFFGSAMLNIEKEIEGGSRLKLSIMPSKSTSSGYNFGNLVHEASFSIPLGEDPTTRLIGGQVPDWSGYEYIPSNQNKLITHNMLFDFSAANFYTGVGMELTRGKWISKFMLGNMNRARIDTAQQKTPGLFYRVDYAKGEFQGFGFSGIHSGFDDKSQFGRLDIVEIDGYFIRADWTLQGQLTWGRQKPTPGNQFANGRTQWTGLSALAGYKFTPRFEGIARLDYIWNSKNGGGLLGSTFATGCKDAGGADALCPDGRNGFGAAMVFDGANWLVADPTRGVNRMALSLGWQYALMPGVNLKGEYRYDRASGAVFKNANGDYVRDNHIFGFSTVFSF